MHGRGGAVDVVVVLQIAPFCLSSGGSINGRFKLTEQGDIFAPVETQRLPAAPGCRVSLQEHAASGWHLLEQKNTYADVKFASLALSLHEVSNMFLRELIHS